MASQLRVRIHGQDYGVLELHQDMEYFAGRGSQSHIVLQNERGISRQHIKIVFQDGFWTVHLLSRFGGLIFQGAEVEMIQLQHGATFAIDPYEFIYEEIGAQSVDATQVMGPNEVDDISMDDPDADYSKITPNPENLMPADKTFSNIPEISPPEDQTEEPPYYDEENVESHEEVPQDDFIGSEEPPHIHQGPDLPEAEPTHIAATSSLDDQENTDEFTMVSNSNLVAHLRISTKKDEPEEILKLDGELWTAGRSPSCEIYINNKNVSRKHFDIHKQGDKYYLTDHGSSNGTLINGEPVVAKTPTELDSGDILKIKSVEVVFEIRDSSFDKKLAVLPTPESEPMGEIEMADIGENYNGPAVMQVKSPQSQASPKKKPNRMVLVIAVVLILGGALFYEDTNKPKVQEKTDGSSNAAKLSEEQKREIKSLYDVARSQYRTGKFELCLSQLRKLHTIVPSYEDSRDVQNHCEQAIELNNEVRDRERRELIAQQNEEKIKVVTEECKAKINPKTTVEQMRECLSPAILIDPENLLITDVLTVVEANQEEQRLKQDQQNRQKRICSAALRQYNRAKGAEKSGNIKLAIKEYQIFINGNFPCMKKEQGAASRSIASLKSTLAGKVKEKMGQCDALFKQQKFTEALSACREALKEDPKNREIQSLKRDIEKQACGTAKTLFEDSSFEESMGNLDSAKQKWQEILKLGVKKCPQYGRAKRKLRKYGD